jgi:hypothetical protein
MTLILVSGISVKETLSMSLKILALNSANSLPYTSIAIASLIWFQIVQIQTCHSEPIDIEL